jgi:hypothetical protein
MIRENEDLHGRRNKMNYMKKVANMLGVELGEEFYLKKGNFKYKLVQSGLLFKDGGWYNASITLVELLSGEKEIEWKPKDGEQCWFIYADIQEPQFETFSDTAYHDNILLSRGLITKTKEDAINIMKEWGWLE